LNIGVPENEWKEGSKLNGGIRGGKHEEKSEKIKLKDKKMDDLRV